MIKVMMTALVFFLSMQAHAKLKIDDSRQGAMVYGFLSTLASPQNAGDGVLLVSAEVSCSLHKGNGQHYCMSDVGGITGDIAATLYQSFSKDAQEDFGEVTLRSGVVSCASIEESGKAARFNCY